MSNQKIDPVKEFANLRDSVSRAIGQSIQSLAGGLYPLIDIYESEKSVIVRTAPLDGLVPDSIEVGMEDDMLTIRGETKSADEVQDDAYLQRERRFGKFTRTVRIPRAVDSESAQAAFKAGILTVTLPKLADSRPQVIEVTETE